MLKKEKNECQVLTLASFAVFTERERERRVREEEKRRKKNETASKRQPTAAGCIMKD